MSSTVDLGTSAALIYKPYPMLVFDILVPYISALPQVDVCVTRLLVPTDPNSTVGITVSEWVPGEATMGRFEPMSGDYEIILQAMTKNTNAADGEVQHYGLADALKRMLYRDTDLAAALGAIHVDDPLAEHTLRWGIVSQRFANNDIGSEFVFLSATTLFFTSEVAC